MIFKSFENIYFEVVIGAVKEVRYPLSRVLSGTILAISSLAPFSLFGNSFYLLTRDVFSS